MNSRKQAFFAALAGLFLVAALITALVWALVLEQQRRKPSSSGTSRAEPTGELRIYGGLPNASNYGHPAVLKLRYQVYADAKLWPMALHGLHRNIS